MHLLLLSKIDIAVAGVGGIGFECMCMCTLCFQGLVVLNNFLPPSVAALVASRIAALAPAAYSPAASRPSDTVQHRFALAEVRTDPVLAQACRLLWRLQAQCLPNFSVAKYTARDHITPHDDRVLERYTAEEYRCLMAAYRDCRPSEVTLPAPLRTSHTRGNAGVFSRTIAVVLYLNKGWSPSDGGYFVDLENDKLYLPSFNRLVAFRVPRMHAVTPVIGPRPRLSIFGWWLAPGMLYSDSD